MKNNLRGSSIFTAYVFDDTFKQYVRIMEMESEGLFNLLLTAMPYENVYILDKRGPRFIDRFKGAELKKVKTGFKKKEDGASREGNPDKHSFDIQLVIEAGYEQLECNNEGLTDFDDAVRIACEQKDMASPTKEERKQAKSIFESEFKWYADNHKSK